MEGSDTATPIAVSQCTNSRVQCHKSSARLSQSGIPQQLVDFYRDLFLPAKPGLRPARSSRSKKSINVRLVRLSAVLGMARTRYVRVLPGAGTSWRPVGQGCAHAGIGARSTSAARFSSGATRANNGSGRGERRRAQAPGALLGGAHISCLGMRAEKRKGPLRTAAQV